MSDKRADALDYLSPLRGYDGRWGTDCGLTPAATICRRFAAENALKPDEPVLSIEKTERFIPPPSFCLCDRAMFIASSIRLDRTIRNLWVSVMAVEGRASVIPK